MCKVSPLWKITQAFKLFVFILTSEKESPNNELNYFLTFAIFGVSH